MGKEAIGLAIIAIAALNINWAIKINTLLRSGKTEEEREKNKEEAQKLSRLSKISYTAVAAIYIAWLFLDKK
jgi:hypothetical protein